MSNDKYITPEEYEFLKDAYYQASETNDIKHYYNLPQTYYSNNRKTIQRCMNAYIRNINKSISNDYLWRSRFFIRQVGNASYYPFEDKSGAELYVHLRIYDKKTMKYLDLHNSVSHYCHSNGYRLSLLVNNAIVEHFEKYDKDYHPGNDMINYWNIKEDEVVNNATPVYEIYNYIST